MIHLMDACCVQSAHSAAQELAEWMRYDVFAFLMVQPQWNQSNDFGRICNDSNAWCLFFFPTKKQIAGKKKSNWKEKPNDLLLKFNYLSSASFIHRSSTGLIFWADFGVISSFSNLKLFNFGNLRSSFEILLQKRRLNI